MLKVIIFAIFFTHIHGLEFLCATYNTTSSNNSMYDDFLVEGDALTQRVVSNSSCEVSGEGSACYGFWKNGTSNGTVVRPFLLKGCWSSHRDCFNKTECVANYFGNDHYFCCCDSPMCNIKMTLTSEPAKTMSNGRSDLLQIAGDVLGGKQGSSEPKVILIALSPIILLAVIIVVIFLSWRVCRGRIRGDSSSSSASIESKEAPLLPPRASPTPSIDAETILKNIQLLEIIADRHSGGCVRRAKLENEIVAVKIFTVHEKSLWEKERDMFTLTGLRNSNHNILRYIGSLRNETSLKMSEFWLITEYQEMGCLYDYLKTHTLSWTEAIRIIVSSCVGLAFVHLSSADNSPLLRTEDNKLPVAHRDVKSRNILLKNNLTACIADFGLAIALDRNTGTAHSQVGTLRYMSPEVLDGSIYHDVDSFFKIDAYAFALVAWEILTRTYANGVEAAAEYKLPFEKEVGLNVSLEDMKQAVVDEHLRPQIRQEWRKHEGMSILVAAIEEMWDRDPGGRLSVISACHRLSYLLHDEHDYLISNKPMSLKTDNSALASDCTAPLLGHADVFGTEALQSPNKDVPTSNSKGGDMQESMTCISIDTDDDYLVPPLNLKVNKVINCGSSPQVMNGYIVNNTAKITPYENHYSSNPTPFGISSNEKYQSPQHMVYALNHMPLAGSSYVVTEGFSPVKSDFSGLISSPDKHSHIASPLI